MSSGVRARGARFGLTPKKYQSGETDVTGSVSKVGDGTVRAALYEAATAMLRPLTFFSALKHWAMQVASPGLALIHTDVDARGVGQDQLVRFGVGRAAGLLE